MQSTRQSLKEYGRGIAGGLLFSLPLLYTMEVWWAGFIAQPWQLLLFVLVTIGLLLGYNSFAGMHKDATFLEIVLDSVEEMGIALILSFAVLWITDRINLQHQHWEEITGKVAIESMLTAIGVSVGKSQLGAETDDEEPEKKNSKSLGAQAVLSLCGGILVAGNVAPTEEIITIAFDVNGIQLLALVMASLLIGMVIFFFSDFKGSLALHYKTDLFIVLLDTLMAYAISLGTSAFVLWFFGRLTGAQPETIIAELIVLGFPAMLGASAGRLLVK